MSIAQKTDQSVTKNQTDSALEELVSEAHTLFKVLDAGSAKIRDLEKRLGEIRAYFPFSYPVYKEEILSLPTAADELNLYLGEHNCYTQWYIAWEEDDKSKNFRLFLVSRRQEFVVRDLGGNMAESRSPIVDELVFKKPLIETDLATRLKFIEHLHFFIQKFKEHLQRYRISIEEKQIDSFDDTVPF
ncbi:MAG: hypothetical protein HKM07_00505 [Chlamydiae bacterium]|nr:hypothetical protein [Chlamydiota bacterium]